MILRTFFGPTIFTHFLFWAALLIALGDFLATLFTIFYQRFYYTKVLLPKFPPVKTPRCSIIIPCKGVPKNFGKNLEGFLELDYPAYEVLYVTETENDLAVPIIESIVGRHDNARLVIAGFSLSCAQKNHNLLAGVGQADESEVYIFADSDIRPGKSWLKELIRPLADPDIAVTSGFRWLHSTKGTLAEFTHAYANIFMYVLFCCASFIGGVGLWGGSMAIRRKDFVELGVAQKWGSAVVDDLCLSKLVTRKRLKGVIVPQCISSTDDLLLSVKAAILWFERQIMFLRVYYKPLWFFIALPVTVTAVMLLFLLPIAAVASTSETKTFFGMGGGAALAFYFGELITVSLYPLLGSLPRFYRFLLLQPVIRATQAVSYFGTFATNTITWAGVKYHLKFFGDVARVDRFTDTR